MFVQKVGEDICGSPFNKGLRVSNRIKPKGVSSEFYS